MSGLSVLDRGDPLFYSSDVDELPALIFATIGEFLLEIFLELNVAAVLDLASRALSGLFNGLSEVFKGNRVLIGFIYALLGMSAGALSLLVLPHRLIRHPIGFHGIGLLISPIVVGFVLSYVAAVMERRGKKLTGLETFGYGFAFACIAPALGTQLLNADCFHSCGYLYAAPELKITSGQVSKSRVLNSHV